MYTLDYAKTSKGKICSIPWTLLECPPSNLRGKPLSKEKLQDFRKNYELFPPYAREYFDVLLKGSSEDFCDDADGFSSQDFNEEFQPE